MASFGYLLDCLDLELIRVPLAAHTDLLGCRKLWLEDVYETLAGPFQGDARKALALWQSAFPDIEVLAMELHPEGPQAGQIAMARIRLGGGEWRLYDSPPVHDFTFTPSTSIFIDCDDEDQIRRLVDQLGEGGKVMMPLGSYGFSRLFAWIADRFGVSWQLNLP